MPTIRTATTSDIPQIKAITKKAFELYQKQLNKGVKVKALDETDADILFDITNHTVLISCDDKGNILGAVRCEFLNKDVAYIYRFAVDSTISHVGVGSELLKAAITGAKENGAKTITLHTNAKFFSLARYYYGKDFFVHSTDLSRGYIRALFVKELETGAEYDLTQALNK